MSGAAQRVLETFETLQETDKQAVAAEILRRTLGFSDSGLEDDDLSFAADQIFLELDRREGLD
jgi:hypothetical protein